MMIHISKEEREAARKFYLKELAGADGPCILSGPFEGMKYIEHSSGAEYLPKILGTYELELHPWIYEILSSSYDRIINVGCGEGYYTVGLLRAMPSHTMAFAFDASVDALKSLSSLAELNEVSERVEIFGICKSQDLRRCAFPNSIVICDIEGEELNILDPVKIPELQGCDLLVELHDGGGNVSANILRQRFEATHHSRIVFYEGRTSKLQLAEIFENHAFRRAALDENRRVGLSWIFLKRKQ